VLDDAQWVDEVSAAALHFAWRRVTERPVAIVAATRDDGWPVLADAEIVRLDGVDEASGRLIIDTVANVAPFVSARLRAVCGGNPLALVQAGRTLSAQQRSGLEELPDPLPLSGDLATALARRLDGLPDRTLVALAVLAAAVGDDPVALDRAWATVGVDIGDLDAAANADVVVDAGGDVRFQHPLLRTAALTAAGPSLRRIAHRALAEVADDIEHRAHHLDRAADGPDESAASALEEVARRASDARAYEVAGGAWERAAHRSAAPTDRARRLAEAVQCHWNAGRYERGVTAARAAAEHQPAGPRRASLLLALGDMTFFHEDGAAGVKTVLDEAEAQSASDPAASATMLAIGANLVALTGDLGRATRLVRRAVERASRSGDPIALLSCESMVTHVELVHGQSAPDPERLRALVELVGMIDDHSPRELASLGQLVVFDLLSLGRWDDASELGTKVLVQARRHGFASIEAFVHGLLGEVAFRQGRWIEARAESSIEYGFNEARPQPIGSFGHATLARVDAAIGRLDDSRRNATLAVEHGNRTGIRVMEAWGLQALGLAALADGDTAGALDALVPIWELCLSGEIGAPGPLWWQGDLVEALWRVGRSDDLGRFAVQLDDDATRTGSAWAAAIAARAGGLIGGDVDRLLHSAVLLDTMGAPFEAARSRALVAEVDAPGERRDVIAAAAAVFRRLGARPWVVRSEALLGSSTGDGRALINSLSRAELRVALLVGRGRTNREVADELYISARTVDSHLQRIYRKLDLRSRTELALLVAEELT
jgi:DNA-binding CsgD family transcriptional regulator/tetratricopeptide (TPR) repeat protein